MQGEIREYLDDVGRMLDALAPQVPTFVEALHRAFADDRTVFTAGNGGSALNACHLAQDLNKETLPDGGGERRFRAIALPWSNSLMMAWANDCGYEVVFEEQLRNLARRGDLLVAISCSGRSPNVLRAAEYSRQLGMTVVGVTGGDGGALLSLCDPYVHVPHPDVGLVEAVHSALFHLVVSLLQHRLKTPGGGR